MYNITYVFIYRARGGVKRCVSPLVLTNLLLWSKCSLLLYWTVQKPLVTCCFWALDMGPLWLKTWISKFYIIVCIIKAMIFPVFMYECEIWTVMKAECCRTDAFELWCWKRLLSSFDSKEIKPINPKENQSWIFNERTDAEAETPILWPPDVKNWLFGKDPNAGKDWKREEKGMTEDEMVGWHHQLDGHELEQALGVSEGQGCLVCYSPWGLKELNMTRQLNWTEFNLSCIASGCHIGEYNFLKLER